MKRIDEPHRLDGTFLYELRDGRMLRVDQRLVRDIGIKGVAEMYGVKTETTHERVPVFQSGKQIGTVPGDFDPMLIKSKSFLYDPRPGDFKRTNEGWIATRMLGPGDMEAVPGFVWHRTQ